MNNLFSFEDKEGSIMLVNISFVFIVNLIIPNITSGVGGIYL